MKIQIYIDDNSEFSDTVTKKVLGMLSQNKQKVFKETNDLSQVMNCLQLKKLMFELYMDKRDTVIKADFCNSNGNYEGINFEYSDVYKKIFLLELDEIWETPNATGRAIDALLDIETMEKKFEKDLLDFVVEEMEESVRYIYSDLKFYKMKFRINVYSKYFKCWVKVFGLDVKKEEITWEDAFSLKNIRDLLETNIQKNSITREDLKDIFENSLKLQTGMLPILIFEGVRYYDDEEVDEIRYLKKSDIHDDKIVIRNAKNRSEISRIIEIDEKTAKMIKMGMNEQRSTRHVNGKIDVKQYINNDFAVRPLDVSASYRRKNNSAPEGQLTYRGMYQRMVSVKHIAESIGKEQDFTVKNLVKFGKFETMTSYIKRGMNKYDACRKTLMRYGDWVVTGDYQEEKSLGGNRQSVNRLTRDYDLNS